VHPLIQSVLARAASLALVVVLPLSAAPVGLAQAAVPAKEYAVSMMGTRGPEQLGTAATRLSMAAAKRAGANRVTLVHQYCQKDQYGAILFRCANTPSDTALRTAIRGARSLRLQVDVAVHMEALNGRWRGSFCPRNRPAWFAGYRKELVRLGRVLQAERVPQFVLGAELTCLTIDARDRNNTVRWRSLISSVRAVYRGRLSYSAHRDSTDQYTELSLITFWDALDTIGVSAYDPLPTSGPPTVAALRARWDLIAARSYAPLVRRWHKPLVMSEVGYRSVAGARLAPYDYRRVAPLDLAEQARDYEALLTFVKTSSVVSGVHLWAWDPDPSAGGPRDRGYTPQGKPAQAVMQRVLAPGLPTPAR
jgi:hypothetical protein